jgi:ABC-type antimicrobial peptide transport system permease subunit
MGRISRTASLPAIWAVKGCELVRLDAQLALSNVRTLDETVRRSIINERLVATLSGALSMMATLLSVIGLYGVMAYMVTRRTRDIGIRMALGALARGILREAGWLAGGGLAIGFVPSGDSAGTSSQLYGITPADGGTVVAAALILATVAGLAAFVPARRAARVTPMTALREE